MHYESKLVSILWLKIINTTNYLINLCPTNVNNGKTSIKLFCKRKPEVYHLNFFE